MYGIQQQCLIHLMLSFMIWLLFRTKTRTLPTTMFLSVRPKASIEILHVFSFSHFAFQERRRKQVVHRSAQLQARRCARLGLGQRHFLDLFSSCLSCLESDRKPSPEAKPTPAASPRRFNAEDGHGRISELQKLKLQLSGFDLQSNGCVEKEELQARICCPTFNRNKHKLYVMCHTQSLLPLSLHSLERSDILFQTRSGTVVVPFGRHFGTGLPHGESGH